MKRLSLFLFSLLMIMLFFAGPLWSINAPIVYGQEVATVSLPADLVDYQSVIVKNNLDIAAPATSQKIYDQTVLILSPTQVTATPPVKLARDHILM